jgi:SAM-dependent methyltransferase
VQDPKQIKAFYDREYLRNRYSHVESIEKAIGNRDLRAFVAHYRLYDKKCLEVGCGRGIFQDMVEDYTGIDLAESVRPYIHKPFYQSSATKLPFEDNEFDAIWTIAVLEHVPNPEEAFWEMRRVLKPGGLLFLHAAWQCRPWAANGYSVRPYSDLKLRGKVIKALIPLRDSVLFRSLHIFPRRVLRSLAYAIHGRGTRLRCKQLHPNYDFFWEPDSDALNSMDPYEAILWFLSHDDTCLSHTNWLSRFFVRTGALVFLKKQ